MAKLNISGKIVEVDDSFLSLTPEQQNATVDEIATQLGLAQVSPQKKYTEALQAVRQSQFPNMTDEQFAAYSEKAFAPYDFQDLAQNAQTSGFGDEINAGIGALGSQVRQWTGGGGPGFGEAYDQYKALEEGRRDIGREQQGPMGIVADVVGGVSAFGPGKLAPATTTLNSTIQGAVTGAGAGGLYGFGSADKDRAQEAVKAALLGGAVGGVMPVIGAGLGTIYGNVANRFSRNKAAQSLGVSPEASRMLSETLSVDDALSPAGLARMNAAGKEAMLADAGDSARNYLDFAIQSSGKAGQIAREAIDSRVSRDASALQSALDQALGAPQGINALRGKIAQDSSGARGAAYYDAYSQPIDYASPQGMQLDEILRTRVDASDIAAANNMMRREGYQSNQILAQVGDDGAIVYQRMPDTRQIDYITRALNDKAQANAGLGALGGQTNEGRIFQNLSGDLRGSLREANPAYGDALQTAADPIRRSKAVEFGSEMLKPGITREQVAAQVSGMTAPEKEALALGVRQNFDDTLARVSRTVMDGDIPAREAIAALKQLSTRANREKVALAIGDDAAKELFDELDRVAMSFDLRASTADNSATFRRQEMKRRTEAFTSPDDPMANLLRGEPVKAGKRAVQIMTGQTPDAQMQRQDALLSEVARILTEQGGKAVSNMQALRYLTAKGGANQDVIDALIAAGRRVAAPAAYLSSGQGSGS